MFFTKDAISYELNFTLSSMGSAYSASGSDNIYYSSNVTTDIAESGECIVEL